MPDYYVNDVQISNCKPEMVPGFYIAAELDGKYNSAKGTGFEVKDAAGATVPFKPSSYIMYQSTKEKNKKLITNEDLVVCLAGKGKCGIPHVVECLIPDVCKHLNDLQLKDKLPFWVIIGPKPEQIGDAACKKVPTLYKFSDPNSLSGFYTYYQAMNRYPDQVVSFSVRDSLWEQIDIPIQISFRTSDGMNGVDVNDIGGNETDYVAPPVFHYKFVGFTTPEYKPIPITDTAGHVLTTTDVVTKKYKSLMGPTGLPLIDDNKLNMYQALESNREEEYIRLQKMLAGALDTKPISPYGYTRKEFVRIIDGLITNICILYSKRLADDKRMIAKLQGKTSPVISRQSSRANLESGLQRAGSTFDPTGIFDAMFSQSCRDTGVTSELFLETIRPRYTKVGTIFDIDMGCQPKKETGQSTAVSRQTDVIPIAKWQSSF
jgi:hypothetical protein